MSPDFTTEDTLIAAFDIGKNVHWLGCYDGRLNVIVAPHKLRSDLPGFAQATATIDPLLGDGRFRQALLGNEFTGVYHEPWAWEIQRHYAPHMRPEAACPVEYRWLNPLLTKKRQDETALRQRTSDKTSVRAVAACLADGLGHPAHLYTETGARLRELVRTLEQLTGQQRHLMHQLLPQVDRLWPGAIVDVKQFQAAHPELEPPTPIVQTHALDRDRLGALLLHCPNPHDALALGADGLQALLRQHVGRAGPKTVGALLALLQRAPLPPKEVAAIYAHRLQADYAAYVALHERICAAEAALVALVPASDARFLDAVPGISPLLAAQYCAHIGDVLWFPSASQIWAMAGFDLNSAESGDTKRNGHISKRGSPAFRDTLFQIGQHTARHCATIGLTYLAARERGLDEVAATIHAAHKANRLCFCLLCERRTYRPVAPEEQAVFEQRWRRFWQLNRRQRPQRIAA
jgi:transposase